MYNECREIILKGGRFWGLSENTNHESTLIKSEIGVRDDELQPVRAITFSLTNYIRLGNVADPGSTNIGNFSVGCFVKLPVSVKSSNECFILGKGINTGYRLFHQDGDIKFKCFNDSTEQIVSTNGKDFCDGKYHLILGYRDNVFPTGVIGVKVYGEAESEVIADNIIASNSDEFYIGGYPGISYRIGTGAVVYGMFFSRNETFANDVLYEYWRRGTQPPGNKIFLKMDEGVSEAVFDSSTYDNHGVIENYDPADRVIAEGGISWQNIKGYSTGQYLINNGVTSLSVLGSSFNIPADILIPLDILGVKDIASLSGEFIGQCRYNLELKDILAFRGNNKTYATPANIQGINLIPSINEFSIFFEFQKFTNAGGTIISYGTNPGYLYKFSVSKVDNKLNVTLAGETFFIDIVEGTNRVLFNIGLTKCRVYLNNDFVDEYDIGNTINTGALRLFNDDNNDLLNTTVVFVAIKNKQLIQSEIDVLFDGTVKMPPLLKAFWYPFFNYKYVYDLAGNHHALFTDYLQNVWSGRQSSYTKMYYGYTKVYNIDIPDGSEYSIIPYDLLNRPIPSALYDLARPVEYVRVQGHNGFDSYIDMNPNNLEYGFIAEFWDKRNTDVWNSLNPLYKNSSHPFYWHVNELNMPYFYASLSPAYYNFAFCGGEEDFICKPREIRDLIFINEGNDYRPLPIPYI